MTMTITTEKDYAEALACYLVLNEFDSARRLLGHDYGGARRERELDRLADELHHAGVRPETLARLDLGDLAAAALTVGWERVGQPRLRRVRRERTGHPSPACERTAPSVGGSRATHHRAPRPTHYGRRARRVSRAR